MARSDFILGRTANRKAFEAAKQGGKSPQQERGREAHRAPTERPLSRYPWYVKDISNKKIARIRVIITPKKDYKP